MIHQNLKLFGRLRAVGARYGRSPGETAIPSTLRHPAVIGARSLKQVDGIIGATVRLTPSEICEVKVQKKEIVFESFFYIDFLATVIPAR
jgi:hypothetical protein